VDGLFVDKGFAGLRRNFDVDVQRLDLWNKKEKEKEVETKEVAL